MTIKEYIKNFNKPFENVKSDYRNEFINLKEEEREWSGNLENKTHLIENNWDKEKIDSVIQKLKNSYQFTENDTDELSTFISQINKIVSITNRINNFKEGTILEDGSSLNLYKLFNDLCSERKYEKLKVKLNSNLNQFLPHLFSVIKHCQDPLNYPIYYKYWKNILREVLGKSDDYDTFCEFYRTLPVDERHLNFAAYLGVIGLEIAKQIGDCGIDMPLSSREYNYLINNVISVKRYKSILNSELEKINPDKENKVDPIKYWLYAPGEHANKWEEFYSEGIMALGWDNLGDLNQYKDKTEIAKELQKLGGTTSSKKNDATANYEFRSGISIGDIIFVKKGRGVLLGYGIVESNMYFDENRDDYHNCRKVKWENKGQWEVDHHLALKTLTDITKYPSNHPDYTYYYERLLGLITTSKAENTMEFLNPNIILYGPPGTGKTYNTVELAYEIINGIQAKSHNEAQAFYKAERGKRIEFITFHQNMAYEDFIQGIKPDLIVDELKFQKKDGLFKEISDRAKRNYLASLNSEQKEEISFEIVFNLFFEKLQEQVVSEIEVRMKETSFFITEVSDTTIYFRKSGGESKHTLSIISLKKMFLERTNRIIIGGLMPYYNPLLNVLMELEKEMIDKQPQSKEELKNYVLIIDEINRANISRVFGELITLLEKDKRLGQENELTSTLPSGEEFVVPPNLYVIGTLNTADKSIALIDIALRRRFEFQKMYPKYKEDGLDVKYSESLKLMNKKIRELKGADFQIGHAYFMGEDFDLTYTMDKKIIPLLYEYFMNDEDSIEQVLKAAEFKYVKAAETNSGLIEFSNEQ